MRLVFVAITLVGCGHPSVELGPDAPSLDAASAPDALAPDAGGDLALSLAFGGATRTYLLHAPAGLAAAARAPLMLAFHGTGGSGMGMRNTTGFDAVADANGFFVAYPDSVGPQWQETGANNDLDFIAALVAALEAAYPIDPAQVYVSGFSDGGGMSTAYACAHADAIAGAADVSENLNQAFAAQCRPARPVPYILFHGTADPISPYDGGPNGTSGAITESAQDTAAFWATNDGCTGTAATSTFPDTLSDGAPATDTVETWPACGGGATVAFYTIDGGGHAWPGDLGGDMTYGPTSTAIDASQVIWETLHSGG